jgi:hypothetical protein
LGNKVKSGETKIRHFPNPYVMEFIAGYIPKIKYGDRIGEKLQRLGDRIISRFH